MPNNRNARRSKKKASRPPSSKAAEEAVASAVTAAPSESNPLSGRPTQFTPEIRAQLSRHSTHIPADTASADPSCALPEDAGATADPASADSSSTVPAETHPDAVSEAESAESQDDHPYLSILGSRMTEVSAEAQSKFLSPEEQAKHLDPVIVTYLEKLDARKIVVLALRNMATEDSPEFTEIQGEVNAWVALNIGPPIWQGGTALVTRQGGGSGCRAWERQGQAKQGRGAFPGVRRDYHRPLRDRDSKSKIVARCREICKSDRGERFAQIVNGVYNVYNKYYKKNWTNWSEEDRRTGWVVHAMQTGANPELVRPWQWVAFSEA
ncbi:hypothetical protein V8F06_010113 [Rhypophila decipiens]